MACNRIGAIRQPCHRQIDCRHSMVSSQLEMDDQILGPRARIARVIMTSWAYPRRQTHEHDIIKVVVASMRMVKI
ncbi:hypothetical protein FRX31_027392 [Thalictrum thalictroides]|uniref:Uncharacterized protein n=1 Tax=Thalictrum thalictroides TaxID=46969 RepID=A0A7J6VD30_THATH|nr:hypothetical protein FRX31_027392 [Thalictrum thalictroides]